MCALIFPIYEIKLIRVQNLPEWVEKVRLPLASRLEGVPTMKIESLDVVGQKAIVEISGSAMQKNGKPYNNRHAPLHEDKTRTS
jgi:hypothetical protein